jgi:hypothetical protein
VRDQVVVKIARRQIRGLGYGPATTRQSTLAAFGRINFGLLTGDEEARLSGALGMLLYFN